MKCPVTCSDVFLSCQQWFSTEPSLLLLCTDWLCSSCHVHCPSDVSALSLVHMECVFPKASLWRNASAHHGCPLCGIHCHKPDSSRKGLGRDRHLEPMCVLVTVYIMDLNVETASIQDYSEGEKYTKPRLVDNLILLGLKLNSRLIKDYFKYLSIKFSLFTMTLRF